MLHADLEGTPGLSAERDSFKARRGGLISIRREVFVYRLNSTLDIYYI